MANKFFNKIMDLTGLNNEYDELEEVGEEYEEEEEVQESVTNKKQNKVLNIHNNISAKIVIFKPTTYEEAVSISDNLKSRKIVVVNTTEMDAKVAQRLLDFMGGASYALGGELQEIEKYIFLLTPSNVEVTSDLKRELAGAGRGMFSWNK